MAQWEILESWVLRGKEMGSRVNLDEIWVHEKKFLTNEILLLMLHDNFLIE